MTTPAPSPSRDADRRRADRAADAVWRRLAQGLSEPWLDDIRALRSDRDAFEASLGIWTAALTVELKNPDRREAASVVLQRLVELPESSVESAG